MNSLTGKQLGPYQIEDRIALGGMAAIYRARQPSTGREVAVKVLPLNLGSDPKLVARFEREAQVLASLQHPHILPLFDFGREGEWLYFVTPLIPHGDLAEYLARYGEALPLPEIRRIFLQLTDALDCAHNGGVIHRDLKPANVLMDARGNCLLSDFGIAKLEGTAALTSVGTALGTPEYMSPEQGTGKPVDARSDIYALGVILFELATGRVPFRAESATSVLLKQVEDPVPAPSSFNQDLLPALEAVILKALAKRPEERYQTAAALGGAVGAAIAERAKPTAPTVEHPATPPGGQTVLNPAVLVARGAGAPAVNAPAAGARWAGVTPLNPAVVASQASTVATRTARDRTPLLVIGFALAVLVGLGLWLALGRTPSSQPLATAPTSAAPPPGTPVPPPPAPSALPPLPPPPPSPAVTPATTIAAAAAASVFDDFSAPVHDGAYDAARWGPIYGAVDTQVRQRNGVLHLTTREQAKGISTTAPSSGAPVRVSVRVRTAAPAQTGSLGITLSLYPAGSLQPSWWAACYLASKRSVHTVVPTCTDIGYVTFPAGAAVPLESWHELALVPEPAQNRVRLLVDGRPIGNLPLPDPGKPGAHWYVSLTGWSQEGQTVEGDFDDVVIK